MARLQSIQDLANYSLRALGGGINDIEITPEQLEDRVLEAIDFFVDRHYDGTEEKWVTYQVTDSDVAQGAIHLESDVVAVLGVQETSSTSSFSKYGVNVAGIGIVSYDTTTTGLLAFGSGYDNLTGYYISKSYLNLMNDLLNPAPFVNYNCMTGKLVLQGQTLSEGSLFVIHCYENINAEENINVYNNHIVKELTTAYIKKQWGTNLKKYKNVELPSGISIDGQTIYDEAIAEIEHIMQEFEDRYESPACFFVG